jgi:YjbE family integral membrane protein
MAEIATAQFWSGLAAVIWVNAVLSCDNAVVIALAVRGLPARERVRAVAWGAGLALVLRIALTAAAVELLKLPFLRIAGGLALMWIGVRLLAPGSEDRAVAARDGLLPAILTIVVADLTMSLDNVIAVAAAAQGSLLALVMGLAVSMPFIVFGAALLLKLIERHPMIIVLGAAIIGWVAGGLLVTDPLVVEWLARNLPWLHDGAMTWAAAAGALLVVGAGKWLATSAARKREHASKR